ncbi:MAG: DUF120 domain-containing protein [Candidatus Helarchaeota archaeon]
MKKTKDLWPYLIMLAKLGALTKEIDISTSRFAREFSEGATISQQTASRKLNELEEQKWIIKRPSIKGQYIRITQSGEQELEKIRDLLADAFMIRDKIIDIQGELFTGMGEGGHYISLEKYYTQFVEKLAFKKVFAGTLNLKLKNRRDMEKRRLLQDKTTQGIRIDGFKDATRTYGPVTCFKATINNKIEGAVLVIQRTSWKEDVLEIISPHNLREQLGLKDGDLVSVRVFLE